MNFKNEFYNILSQAESLFLSHKPSHTLFRRSWKKTWFYTKWRISLNRVDWLSITFLSIHFKFYTVKSWINFMFIFSNRLEIISTINIHHSVYGCLSHVSADKRHLPRKKSADILKNLFKSGLVMPVLYPTMYRCPSRCIDPLELGVHSVHLSYYV